MTTVEIDKSKWEKIPFNDIESGDHLLVVRHSSIVYIKPGTLEGVVGKNGGNWIIAGWPVTSTGIHDLIIYKKRPEFVIPSGVGAVITARNKSDVEHTFVYADPTADEYRWWGDEEWFSDEEIMDGFHGHFVVSEGVTL